MAKRKPKREIPDVAVPETESAARALARRIGELLASLERADAAKGEAELKAAQAHAEIAGPLNDELAATTRALETYATRAVATKTLFVEGKRSAEWAEATIGFRDHPPSVRIARGFREDAIVATLLKARRLTFLRRTVELDRDALLKQPDAARKIDGVEIVQGESFFVRPKAAASWVALRLGKIKIEESNDG